MIIFKGYIILPKRKRILTFRDINFAIQCGVLYKTKRAAYSSGYYNDTYERIEKITIEANYK